MMGCSQVVRQRTLTPLCEGSTPSIPAFSTKITMKIGIEIQEGIMETSFPMVKLTKSKNGETGTATFLFFHPSCINQLKSKQIDKISLYLNEKKIESQEIKVFFKDGIPTLLKAIFIFKNRSEWFEFFTFITQYSKEKGFFFETEDEKLF